MDDEILEHFKRDFPDFDPKEAIDEDAMKSKEGKKRWRDFMMAYEKKVDDYNFGTMLRANPKFEYGEKETIFGELLPHIPGLLSLNFEKLCGCNFTPSRSLGNINVLLSFF